MVRLMFAPWIHLKMVLCSRWAYSAFDDGDDDNGSIDDDDDEGERSKFMLWKWLCMLQNGNAARKSIWKTKNVSKSKIGARTSRFCIEMSMCWNQSSYSNSQHHCWGTWPENAGQNMSVAWVDEKRLHNDLIFQHIKTIKYFSFSCHILETNWMKCNKRSTFYTLSPSDPMMENHFSFYRSLLFLNSRECMVYYVVQIEQRKYFSLFVPPTHTHKKE